MAVIVVRSRLRKHMTWYLNQIMFIVKLAIEDEINSVINIMCKSYKVLFLLE